MVHRIINTFDVYNDDFEGFKDYCEVNGYEVVGEGENMVGMYMGGKISYYNWIDDERNCVIEDFWDSLKYADIVCPCVVSGTLGLWNGKKQIKHTVFNSLYDAFNACVGDAYEFEVSFDDETNTIYFDAYHHDGSNRFEINLVGFFDAEIVKDLDEDDIEEYLDTHKRNVEFSYFGI